MKAEDFKSYLSEDIDRIKRVLESVGVHRIWEASHEELRGAPPDTNNHTAISVNVDTLYCCYYKSDETLRTDIIGLVQHMRDESFPNSFRFLTSLFGLSSSKFVKEDKIDPLARFKGIRKKNKPIASIEEIQVPKFGKEVLADFIMLPHMSLFHEGIMPQTSELFDICYDPQLDRIIFPHHSFDDKNAIVGMTGRTTHSKEEINQLLIPKYWNYVKGYKKMYNLYGFSYAIEFVKKHGILVIFEAEKSVLKNWTQTKNEGYSCAVGGHEISDVQLQIIMKYLPVDVEIVIAFDKDIMMMKDKKTQEHIGEEFLINTAKRFSKYRNASYIYDTDDLLEDFDSPIDKGYRVFHELLEGRKQVK
ncbi:hypothetical protein [Viridibacillus arvi]|uniref:hypothetical protein n=1 Tax=Viridibacillus arvi TaxID=263475 RepID=UPI0034CF1EE2